MKMKSYDLMNMQNMKKQFNETKHTLIYCKCRHTIEQRSWYSYPRSPR
jgi:hypothetical protein